MTALDSSLLTHIAIPDDLRQLPPEQLTQVADQLRAYLIDSVAQSGGHFAAGLGAVELTVALHYCLDTPHDRLVWDVGHQCYPHKILTGRRDAIHTIRQWQGLSGFPRREESEYDTFGVGHAGTSIGAAIGMAEAARLTGEQRTVVAIIGDGALTAGMAFEALNHAGDIDANLIVVLNDNNMSISPNVGALSNTLTRMLSGPLYHNVRAGSKRVLKHLPPVEALARRTKEHVKGMISPGALFEEMGFHYFGPIDGHNLKTLVATLNNLKSQSGPRLLHTVTRKGQGYPLAEQDPVKYHGVGPFNPATGLTATPPAAPTPALTYTQVFSQWLCDMATADERLVGITPAMREGSGLVEFSKRFASRYYDVAIAEQHAVTLAAGLACEGMRPVVAIYSTFLQRGYDQLIHDVAIQNLPVTFALDRGGLVGPDGATHAGIFDLSYLRCVPNLLVMAPADESECRRLLTTAFQSGQPAAVRYPRGKGPGTPVEADLTAIALGESTTARQGDTVAILNFGALLAAARPAADALNATLVDMRFIKPLDQSRLLELAADHRLLVSIEDNVIMGGAGSAVAECLHAHGLNTPLLMLGIADHFQEHGSREQLLRDNGLDAAGIERAIRQRLNDG